MQASKIIQSFKKNNPKIHRPNKIEDNCHNPKCLTRWKQNNYNNKLNCAEFLSVITKNTLQQKKSENLFTNTIPISPTWLIKKTVLPTNATNRTNQTHGFYPSRTQKTSTPKFTASSANKIPPQFSIPTTLKNVFSIPLTAHEPNGLRTNCSLVQLHYRKRNLSNCLIHSILQKNFCEAWTRQNSTNQLKRCAQTRKQLLPQHQYSTNSFIDVNKCCAKILEICTFPLTNYRITRYDVQTSGQGTKVISILHKGFSHFLSLWPKPQYLPPKKKTTIFKRNSTEENNNNNNNANDKKNQKNKQHQQSTATSCAQIPTIIPSLTNQSNNNNTCNLFLNTHCIDCAHALKNQINPQHIETCKLLREIWAKKNA